MSFFLFLHFLALLWKQNKQKQRKEKINNNLHTFKFYSSHFDWSCFYMCATDKKVIGETRGWGCVWKWKSYVTICGDYEISVYRFIISFLFIHQLNSGRQQQLSHHSLRHLPTAIGVDSFEPDWDCWSLTNYVAQVGTRRVGRS